MGSGTSLVQGKIQDVQFGGIRVQFVVALSNVLTEFMILWCVFNDKAKYCLLL